MHSLVATRDADGSKEATLERRWSLHVSRLPRTREDYVKSSSPTPLPAV